MSLPCLPSSSSGVIEAVSLSKTARLLACGCETTGFSVLQIALVSCSICRHSKVEYMLYLVNWVNDPVDSWVSSDGFVGRINEDDLEVFVCRILVDPV